MAPSSSTQNGIQAPPFDKIGHGIGNLEFKNAARKRRISLPILTFDGFRRPSHTGIEKIVSKNSRGNDSREHLPTSPSSTEPGIAALDFQIQSLAPSFGPVPGERRNSGVGDIVLAARTKVQRLIKSHRIVIRRKGEEAVVEEGIDGEYWTEKFTLNLPEAISRDKSELDYLRRTNIEAATKEILMSGFTKMSTQSSQPSLLEVVTEITLACDSKTQRISQSEEVRIRWADQATESANPDSTDAASIHTEDAVPGEHGKFTTSLRGTPFHASKFQNINRYTFSLKEELVKKHIGKVRTFQATLRIVANYHMHREL
jgi:hypothetical protein